MPTVVRRHRRERAGDGRRDPRTRGRAARRPGAAGLRLAGAHDYAGEEAAARPPLQAGLDAGLEEPFRGRAVIQLASTLRNLGRYDEAAAWLEQTFAEGDPGHPLSDAASAFMALARCPARATTRRPPRWRWTRFPGTSRSTVVLSGSMPRSC